MSETTRRRRLWPPETRELRPPDECLLEAACAAALAIDPKSLSLCTQARHALEYAIGGECRDEALTGLEVVEVLPDPTVRRLRVWLCSPAEMDEHERRHVLRRLEAARGFLRSRVAAAIHRKRTPELVFELLMAAGDESEWRG